MSFDLQERRPAEDPACTGHGASVALNPSRALAEGPAFDNRTTHSPTWEEHRALELRLVRLECVFLISGIVQMALFAIYIVLR